PRKAAATAPRASAPAPAARGGGAPGGSLASSAAAAASAARPGAVVKDVPPPEYDKAKFWGKVVVCPVSNTRFMALNVRPEAFQLKTRDSDFREVVSGPNPLWYVVYAC